MTLDRPLSLAHGLSLPNRIAKAAMSERLADPDGTPTEALVRLYRRWSEGGTGLLITGNVMVDARAIGETGNVILEDDTQLDAFRAWADAAKSGGARVWMQINHPGRQSPRNLSRRPVAPSAIGLKGMGGAFAKPRALLEEEIFDIIARFARTAAFAERAGFDGVQIHGAHGYLLSQFLSPRTNQRDDAWGGDAERRRRFPLEVARAVRAAASDDFSVGLKLNSADFQRGGFDEDESMAFVEALSDTGVDLLEISGGTYESTAMFEETVPQHESSRRREAFFLDYAEKVRARTKLPLMVTGGFRTRQGMMSAIDSGATDVIGMGRPLAVEPDLARRVQQDGPENESVGALPIRIATGVKAIDAVLQGAWYQRQIDRLGHGLEPDPTLGRLTSLLAYLGPRRAQRAIPRVPPAEVTAAPVEARSAS